MAIVKKSDHKHCGECGEEEPEEPLPTVGRGAE